jgi:pSer/pThr/pTyr-binding forkhead associated (FHA) protein
MPSAGVKQRTVAMNIGGGGGGGGVSGSMSDGLIGWFIPLEGRQSGELFQLRGRVTVGTSDDNDIVMQDSPSISGHHCEFVATQGGFKLNDLGSTNGTYVNDKRVNTHDLVDNDNVRLGKVHFKYKSMI